MSVVSVYTMLKNTDLHSLSAQEAIHEMMAYPSLVSLRRFGLWEVTLASSGDAALNEVQQIIDQSYYLLNPNKEHYFISNLPATPTSSAHVRFLIKVTNRLLQPDYDAIIEKIEKRVGVKVNALSYYLLWEVVVDRRNLSDTALRAEVEKKVIASADRAHGILINPLYETMSFLEPAYAG